MTSAEIKEYFLAEYDAATSLSAPAWEDSEISSFCNIAQDSIVTELFKAGELGRIAELLNTQQLGLTAHPNIINGYRFTLTDIDLSTYFYYVNSRTYVTARTNPVISREWIPNELVDRVNVTKFEQTTFNKPWFKYPKILIDSVYEHGLNELQYIVLIDGYTSPVDNSEITYIKKPIRIDITGGITTNLNESLHQMVVQLAVEQAVKSIKIAKISNQ